VDDACPCPRVDLGLGPGRSRDSTSRHSSSAVTAVAFEDLDLDQDQERVGASAVVGSLSSSCAVTEVSDGHRLALEEKGRVVKPKAVERRDDSYHPGWVTVGEVGPAEVYHAHRDHEVDMAQAVHP